MGYESVTAKLEVSCGIGYGILDTYFFSKHSDRVGIAHVSDKTNNPHSQTDTSSPDEGAALRKLAN